MDIDRETKTIERKRNQFSVIFWIGIVMLPISMYFAMFYIKKKDIINFDSYAMMNDFESVNSVNDIDLDEFKYGFTMQVDSRTFSRNLVEYSRIKNYMFASILHTLLFVKRGGRSASEYIFNGSISFDNSFTHVFNVTMSGRANASATIPVRMKEMYPSPSDINKAITKYATSIEFIVIRQREFDAIDLNISAAITLGNVYYSEMSSAPSTVDILIRDATSMKVNYDFPVLENWAVSAVSLIALFISVVFIFVFLWHWWSVRYIIIETFIRHNISSQKWY